jgi:hypothetical protein
MGKKEIRVCVIGLTIAVLGFGGIALSQTADLAKAKAAGNSSLFASFSFLDGGSSGNSAYASVNTSTNVSYASDNPSGTTGTTSWTADYANLSMTTETRLGGKSISAVQNDDSTAWCNIRTNFTFDKSIDAVKILGVAAFGTKLNLGNIYLQSSIMGSSWTTVFTYTDSQTLGVAPSGSRITLLFSGFSVPADSYLRIGCALAASATNSGFSFTGLSVHSYSLC